MLVLVGDTVGVLVGVGLGVSVGVRVGVFVGANFVASVFLTWMPSFLVRKFAMKLSMAGFSSTAYLQIASVLGALCT